MIGNPNKGYSGSKYSTINQIVTTSLTSVTLSTENNSTQRVWIKCKVTNIQSDYANGKIPYECYKVDDKRVETIKLQEYT